MKLSKIVLLAMKGSKELRDQLATELDVSITTVNRWVADNDDNLTKAAALQIIREKTGLEDSQILEETTSEGVGATK